jgi:hypothetical protein
VPANDPAVFRPYLEGLGLPRIGRIKNDRRLSPPYATALSRKMTVLLACLPSTLLNSLKRRNHGLPRLPKTYDGRRAATWFGYHDRRGGP